MLEFENFILGISKPVADQKKSNLSQLSFWDICSKDVMVDSKTQKLLEDGCSTYYNDPSYSQFTSYCNLPEQKLWC